MNPKDRVGSTKVPLSLVPPVGTIYGAVAMRRGAEKYGAYNWRTDPPRLMTYLSAIQRHVAALIDGAWTDEEGVPHLGAIIASAAIVADAHELNILIDDRPPRGAAEVTLREHRREVKKGKRSASHQRSC